MIDLARLRGGPHRFSVRAGPPRVALVHHGFRTTQLGLRDGRRTRFAPRFASLGLLNIARSLRADAESGALPFTPELRYFDEDTYADDGQLAAAVAAWLDPAPARFLLVGLYSLALDRTAAFLALIDPDRYCIVAGGAHPTVAPRTDMAHVVVRGEGGAATRHLLSTLLEPGFGDGPDSAGMCYSLDGEEVVSGAVFDRSLCTVPAPAFAYDLSQSRDATEGRPWVRWWMSVGSSPQIYICTQSCRARCTFCSTYLVHGRSTSRPVGLVEQDLRYLVDEFGHDSIEFHDDDLLQHGELDELLDVLARLGLRWTCNARAEYIVPGMAERLYAAGCRKVFLGLESLSQRSLDYYRKATTVEQNRAAVHALDAAGIGVVSGFIFGAPHDTLSSSLAEIDGLLELPVYFLSASILTPDIGTVEYQRAKKRIPELRMLGDHGTRHNLRPRPELFGAQSPYGLPTVCEELGKDRLNEIYELACCAFFLRDGTRARIDRLTPDDRRDDVDSWYAWIEERAARLAATATTPEVRERAEAIPLPVPGRAPTAGRPDGGLADDLDRAPA